MRRLMFIIKNKLYILSVPNNLVYNRGRLANSRKNCIINMSKPICEYALDIVIMWHNGDQNIILEGPLEETYIDDSDETIYNFVLECYSYD